MNNRETVRRFTRYLQSGKPEPKAPAPVRHRPLPRAHRRGRRTTTLFLPQEGRQQVYAYLRHHHPRETTKAPGPPRPLCLPATDVYFSEALIEVNLAFRLVPRPLTTAMIASEIPAAIRPYSMAVAPDSSLTKRAIRFFIGSSMCTRGWSTDVWSRRRSQHRDHRATLRSDNFSAVNSTA